MTYSDSLYANHITVYRCVSLQCTDVSVLHGSCTMTSSYSTMHPTPGFMCQQNMADQNISVTIISPTEHNAQR